MPDFPCTISNLSVYIDPGGKSWTNQEAIDRVVTRVSESVREAARMARGPIKVSVVVTLEEPKEDV